jgi:hypothetical protein
LALDQNNPQLAVFLPHIFADGFVEKEMLHFVVFKETTYGKGKDILVRRHEGP